MDVFVFLYDLSQGFAKAMSLPLAGRQIDGIWHTSVVVYGREYCFGQGIEVFEPGKAPHGVPVEKIAMGKTEIPKEVFLEYLENMRAVWTADKYHLLDNNCNSFSDDMCRFLVGNGIPSHITSLPAEFLNTPLGQAVLPMIEGMFGKSRQNQVVAQSSQPSHPAAHVFPCTSTMEFQKHLKTHRCVAVDFTGQNCPPCRMISPEFDRMITEANETYSPMGASVPKVPILGLSVEVGNARELAMQFGIAATPTFIFFLDGNKFHEFRGANVAELKSSIDLLLFTAYPPHSHAKLKIPNLVSLRDSEPINFIQSSNLDAIFAKLKSFALDQKSIKYDELTAQSLLGWMKKPNRGQIKANVPKWEAFATLLLFELPINRVFPLLDIIRLIITMDDSCRSFFVSNDSSSSLLSCIKRINKASDSLEKPSRLMMMRLACNLFTPSDPSIPITQFKNVTFDGPETGRDVFTQLLLDHLLSSDAALWKPASVMAYNLAWSITGLRIQTTNQDESYLSELVAAVCNAIEIDSSSSLPEDDDVTLRLVGALGMLLVFSGESVVELARVVGVSENLGVTSKRLQAANNQKRQLICGLIREIDLILDIVAS